MGSDLARRDVVGTALGVTALLLPVYWRLSGSTAATIRGENDLPQTIVEARWARIVPWRPSAPHFLFPLLSRILATVVDLRVAVVVVCALAGGAAYAAIVALGPTTAFRPGRWTVTSGAVVAAAVFWTESTAVLVPASPPDAWRLWGRSSFADVHHLASPTDLLSLAFALPLIGVVARAWWSDGVDDREGRSAATGGQLLAIATLTVLTALAKPSLVLPGLVALPAFIVWQRGVNRAAVREIAAFAAPAALVLGWQAWFLRTGQTPFDSSGGWTVRPLWVFTQPGMGQPAFYLALVLVPLIAWVGGRAFFDDPLVRASLLLWAAAQLPTLLLQETGAQADDGNFTVGSRLAYLVLVVAAIRWLVRHREVLAWQRGPGHARRQILVCALALGVMSGIVSYFSALGLVH